ncbi:MAG: M20/M25/M40 family metallo-hydrolase [Clostridia bacterium]|nr:M20/M25/M40 family metallo-hydrolase [Clostridia bacterium]
MIYIIIGIVAAILAVAAICIIRTLMCKPPKDAVIELSQTETDRAKAYADKLSKLIRCETVSSRYDSDKTKFLEFHKVLEREFPAIHRVCTKHEFNGNLLFHWAGKQKGEPIMLMSHHDVVEATGEWSHGAFSGDIEGGCLWGRGTQETKGSLFCFLTAVEELIESGYTPECDVYLASSCTEEFSGEGGPLIAKYLKDNGIHLRLLVDEGGAILSKPIGGVNGTFALLGVLEKGYGDLKFVARSTGGHASAPKKNSPIVRLGKFVCEIEKHDPFVSRLHPTAREMFARMTPYMGFGMRLIFCNLWLFEKLLLKLMPAISAQGAAMLKTTCAFTTCRGSDGLNVLPQTAYVTANMRFIHHQSTDESIAKMTAIAKKYDLDTEIIYKDYPCQVVDYKSKQFELVEQAVKDVYGNIGTCPYPMTAGTDCKFYSQVTDHAVRFSPVYMTAQQLASIHGIDENITVAALPQAVDFYKTLIKKA